MNRKAQKGYTFDSFTLPDRSIREADAAWIEKEPLEDLSLQVGQGVKEVWLIDPGKEAIYTLSKLGSCTKVGL